MMLEQYYVIYFGFFHIHQRNYIKLVWNRSDKFEQVNGGCLMSNVFNCISESIWNQRHVYWIYDWNCLTVG